ncbi:MAG: hypothetical protein HY959_12125 [Ignavibacteriae bacterium]|nr:hypothetical protein [Ignavibacteriota bacterium]
MKQIIIVLIIAVSFTICAQDKKDDSKFILKLSGFVKTDAFFDSRQTVNIREGHFLLYPDNVSLDANKDDINAKSNFNILSIQSRLKVAVTGPDVFDAKPSGVIEADFFGNENSSFSDVNGFRLRHAFVKLNWKTTELLAGQYWHPMFIAESFPGVISFNTGAPFQPFSRNPQIRVSQTMGNLKLIGCVFSQRDFTSFGPDGASSKYIRNSAIPNLHFQMQYKSDSSDFFAGAGVDYKTLTPELYTSNSSATKKFTSDKTLSSLSTIGFLNMKFKPLSIKLEGIFAQNAYDMVMIGGYAVKNIIDTSTGVKEFTNLNTISFWADLQTTGETVQFGLFTGYTKNLGSNDSINGTIYARGSNVDYVYRVAPRIVFISGKFNIALEGEYTFAMYGIVNGDKKGRVTSGYAMNNTRGLLSFIYNF